jgi:hypothetical protein
MVMEGMYGDDVMAEKEEGLKEQTAVTLADNEDEVAVNAIILQICSARDACCEELRRRPLSSSLHPLMPPMMRPELRLHIRVHRHSASRTAPRSRRV